MVTMQINKQETALVVRTLEGLNHHKKLHDLTNDVGESHVNSKRKTRVSPGLQLLSATSDIPTYPTNQSQSCNSNRHWFNSRCLKQSALPDLKLAGKMASKLNCTGTTSKPETAKDDNDNVLGKATESTAGAAGGTSPEYIRSDASLLDMERVNWIIAHRTMLQQGAMLMGNPQLLSGEKVMLGFSFAASDIKSKPAKKVESLKPIYINDIKKTMERRPHYTFKGRIIKLMSIDDVSVGQQSTRMVAEDANKTAYRVIAYNYPYDSHPEQPSPEKVKILQQNLGFGSVFSIMNPYAKTAMWDGEPYIRIENESTLIYHPEESMVDRCRRCYKPGAEKKCSSCRRHYCSRDCQKKDWKFNQHKLICAIKFREFQYYGGANAPVNTMSSSSIKASQWVRQLSRAAKLWKRQVKSLMTMTSVSGVSLSIIITVHTLATIDRPILLGVSVLCGGAGGCGLVEELELEA
ncbi:Dauer abnormal formation protein 25 [Orchesella cincta]|uniref:Dauer abnormal formation protein 25 n=1 Tax=Orchesella cincta TaxID=48709 RepID=A0A1D2MPU3_ORCCI|nr:Dauer abnormal formation protein 25 [Orchesella cincta]